MSAYCHQHRVICQCLPTSTYSLPLPALAALMQDGVSLMIICLSLSATALVRGSLPPWGGLLSHREPWSAACLAGGIHHNSQRKTVLPWLDYLDEFFGRPLRKPFRTAFQRQSCNESSQHVREH